MNLLIICLICLCKKLCLLCLHSYFFYFTYDTGIGVILCIEKALAHSGIPREDINYINAHATSTLVGDLNEYRALIHCFGQNVEVNIFFFYCHIMWQISHNKFTRNKMVYTKKWNRSKHSVKETSYDILLKIINALKWNYC